MMLELRSVQEGELRPPPRTRNPQAGTVKWLSIYIGFWMLWGFLLASGLRKLRRLMREANAE